MGGRGKCLLTNVQVHGEGVTTTHGNTEFILGGWVCVYAFCQGAQNKRHSGVLLNAKGEGDEEKGEKRRVSEWRRQKRSEGRGEGGRRGNKEKQRERKEGGGG